MIGRRIGLFLTMLLALAAVSAQSVEAPAYRSALAKRPSDLRPFLTLHNQSYANVSEWLLKDLKLNLQVDFDHQRLKASGEYRFQNVSSSPWLVLDVQDMQVLRAIDMETQRPLAFAIIENPYGSRGLPSGVHSHALVVETQGITGDLHLRLEWMTEPQSAALQWLEPSQTHDKQSPFLFSQSQAILARSWVPLQDCPSVRFAYQAEVTIPSSMEVVMSAVPVGQSQADSLHRRVLFEQKRPIPSYLLALAVGEFEYQALNDKCGVYAEPGLIKKAVWEFADLPAMIDSAEALYGPYAWGRYDVLVLPPSFPFGGMENPCVTFATPTIIAGDRSLTSLLAHELAHSWSGNLVTNHTWDDFWLNEGFTVYFEGRIIEKVYGKGYADMLTVLGWSDLQSTLNEMRDAPDDTHLHLDLGTRDPDDGLTDIAYEKGRFFLMLVEQRVGRVPFDAFLKRYFESHAFGTMSSEKFIEVLNRDLLDQNPEWDMDLEIEAWIYGEGVPQPWPLFSSQELSRVALMAQTFNRTLRVEDIQTEGFTTHHWLCLLRNLELKDSAQMAKLDKAFAITQKENAEIACLWFVHAVHCQYRLAYAAMESFLGQVGRRKFLMPIYEALAAQSPESREEGLAMYVRVRPGYHSVSRQSLDELFELEHVDEHSMMLHMPSSGAVPALIEAPRETRSPEGSKSDGSGNGTTRDGGTLRDVPPAGDDDDKKN
ncbi:MAG: M1 family metallopeptidase [Bacteroidia bacterium]